VKLWIPVVLVGLAILGYAFFYVLGATEDQGTASFYLTNVIGLVVFVIGVIAAGFVIRRATPHS
jgi:hypothetical protein